METKQIVVRYSVPTRYDTAPFGTLYQVHGDDHQDKVLYIQVSHDVDQPEWMRMSDFLEHVFRNEIYDYRFVSALLDMFHDDTLSMDIVGDLLKSQNKKTST